MGSHMGRRVESSRKTVGRAHSGVKKKEDSLGEVKNTKKPKDTVKEELMKKR